MKIQAGKIIMRYPVIASLVMLVLTACDRSSPGLALGTLERDRITHAATVNEVVIALPVKEGSKVEKGTVLVRLDSQQQEAQVAKADASVAQARAVLEKLHNGAREEEVAFSRAKVAGLRASLVGSEANFKRVNNLVERSLASQADLDRALASRDSDAATLESAKEQLRKVVNGTREEDLKIADAQLAGALASLASETKKLEDLTITSTRTGILDSLPWNLGERVALGSPLAIVLAGKSPYARVYIPEPYRIKVKISDQLLVYVDGLAEPIEGTVRWIATDPAFTPYYALNQKERARLMYLAEIQLPDSASELANGVPAQVQLP